MLLRLLEVAEDGMIGACCNSPGLGLKVREGGRGNAEDVGMVVTGVLRGVVGLYMETGPRPVDRGAERSLT